MKNLHRDSMFDAIEGSSIIEFLFLLVLFVGVVGAVVTVVNKSIKDELTVDAAATQSDTITPSIWSGR